MIVVVDRPRGASRNGMSRRARSTASCSWRQLRDVAPVQVAALVFNQPRQHREPGVGRAPPRARRRADRRHVVLEDLEIVQPAERVLDPLDHFERAAGRGPRRSRRQSRASSAASSRRCGPRAALRARRSVPRPRSPCRAAARAWRCAAPVPAASCASASGAAAPGARRSDDGPACRCRPPSTASSITTRRRSRSSITSARTSERAARGTPWRSPSSSMRCSVTSSSRTVPSACVRRRILRCALPDLLCWSPSVSTGTASRRRRDATRAWWTPTSLPAMAAASCRRNARRATLEEADQR